MGAWIETPLTFRKRRVLTVAPYVGAWIETWIYCCIHSSHTSHPTWVRGLKQHGRAEILTEAKVAPYVGAWIETNYPGEPPIGRKSHPTWVRGLKR